MTNQTWEIKNVCHLRNDTFYPMSSSVNFALSLRLCYSLKIRNCGMTEKEIFCGYGLFQRIKLYQRRYKIKYLDTIEFLDTHV